jgi:hypothetical protein
MYKYSSSEESSRSMEEVENVVRDEFVDIYLNLD